MTANNNSVRSNRPLNNRRHAKNLKESEILRRKGRRVGSDDIGSAAMAAKYGTEAGLRKVQADIGTQVAVALEEAQAMALQDNHRDAAKKVKSCIALVRHHRDLSSLKIVCRDRQERKLIGVLNFFARVHFNIASDILAAQEAEELQAAEAKAKAQAKVIADAEDSFGVTTETEVQEAQEVDTKTA